MKIGIGTLALLVAVVLGGCGGSSGGGTSTGGTQSAATTATSAAAPTSTATASTATASTATASTSASGSTTSASGSSSSFTSGGDCTKLAAMAVQAQQQLQPGNGGTLDLNSALRVDQSLANASPPAIHSDAEYVVGQFATWFTTLQKAGYKPGAAPSATELAALTSIGQQFNQPRFQAAMNHLNAWVRQNCHGA